MSIRTDYKYMECKIKNQLNYDDGNNPEKYKTYKLPYQIIQYEIIKNQDKDYIKKLKKSGVSIIIRKRKTKDGEIQVTYYKVYAIKNFGADHRKKLLIIF